jgi:hypothetical protein
MCGFMGSELVMNQNTADVLNRRNRRNRSAGKKEEMTEISDLAAP